MPTSLSAGAFDLVVLGGGSAGVRLARLSAQCGQRVALVEAQWLGGTCINAGCIPKKLYRYAADYAHALEEAGGYGWRMDGVPHLDFGLLQLQRREQVQRLRQVFEDILRQSGVQRIAGRARLLDAGTVQVEDGPVLRAKHIAIATGARPRRPSIPGGHLALVSDELFELPQVPRHLVIVGGGYVACEMASIFHGLGAKVTLLQRSDRLLRSFDRELSVAWMRQMTAQGIDVRLQTPVRALQVPQGAAAGQREVHLEDGSVLRADAVLYAIGRVPHTDGLGLEKAGVTLDRQGGVLVDACLRSAVRNIFALGDVVTGHQASTTLSMAHATTVAAQLAGRAGYVAGERLVPTAVFTHPELAAVGLTEQEAHDRGMAVQIYTRRFTPLRHRVSGQPQETLLKLVVDARTDRVLGMHMLGEGAAEIVQGFSVAMQTGLTKGVLDASLGIFPTLAEEWMGLDLAPSAPRAWKRGADTAERERYSLP